MSASTDAAHPTPGPGRPRDPQVDQAIIEAAVDLLRDGGVEALSVDGVASRSGVSRASVYRRHQNRIDLMEAAFNAAATAPTTPPDTGSIRTDLIEIVRRVHAALHDTESGRLLPSMVSAAKDNAEVREALERFTTARRTPTIEAIERGVERGELQPDIDPDLVADVLVGAVMYRVLMRNGTFDEEQTSALVGVILSGTGA